MASSLLRYVAWAFAGILGLLLLAIAIVWILGGAKFNRKYVAPTPVISHSTDPEIISAGQRLAAITGCDGCHSARMQGGILGELPDGTRLVSPNIPRVASTYTDADLAKAIRFGVAKNGRGLAAMPSDAFFAMTDEHLIAILSYIRATPDEGADLPNTRLGPLARFFLLAGEFSLAPENIEDFTARPTFDFDNQIDHGRYLALMACAECHGTDFKGTEFPGETNPPDLIVASAYSEDQFRTLMKTGIGVGDRDLGLMTEVSASRFPSLTDDEISALHAFLRDRAMTTE